MLVFGESCEHVGVAPLRLFERLQLRLELLGLLAGYGRDRLLLSKPLLAGRECGESRIELLLRASQLPLALLQRLRACVELRLLLSKDRQGFLLPRKLVER